MSANPPRLILLRGAPGSGKTVTSLLLRQHLSPAVCLGIDTLRYLVTPRVMNPWQLRASKIGAAKMAIHYAREGFQAILESVFQEESTVREIAHLARSAGVGLYVFTLRSSVETTIERNDRRDLFYQTSERRIRELYEVYNWDVGRVIATDEKIAEEVADTILKLLERDPGSAELVPPFAAGTSTGRRYVLFLRHGAATEIRDHYPADGELALSPRGEAQIRSALGALRAFRPTAVFSSASQRARQSAEIIASELGLEVREDSRLGERCLNCLTGRSLDEIKESYSQEFLTHLLENANGIQVPNEDSVEECSRRVVAAVEEIVSSNESRPLIVSHGGPHSWLCCHYLGLPVSQCKGFFIGEAQFSLFELDAAGRFRRLLAMSSPEIPFGEL